MPTKHVYAPTRGMITNVPPTLLPPEGSPWAKGIYLKHGEISSDFGYVNFPEPGDTQTNALNGKVMRIDQFFLLDGESHLLAMTTTCLYRYNTSTFTWDVQSIGNEVDDCDGAWTGGTGVSTVPYDNIKLRDQTSARHCILEFAPVIYFPLNDDAADTDVEDIGGDNTGTASANTSTLSVAAVVGDGFDFEAGTSHYVDMDGAVANVLTDTEGSIVFWVNPEAPLGARTMCAITDESGTGGLVISSTAGGAIRARCHTGTAWAWDVQTADGVLVAGTDYHIAVVHDGVSPKIYLDTEDEGLVWNQDADATSWLADIPLLDVGRIGCDSYSGLGNANFWDGIIDDWRYYSDAITAREVGGLHNDGEGTDQVSGFTTGVVGYDDDVETADISNTTDNTRLAYWIRADKAIAAEVLTIRLSEQVEGGTGATFADYFVPALVADTWQHVVVDITDPDAETGGGGTFPDDLNALASVALVANSDPGPCVIYVDDIRTIRGFTGTEDNRFSTTTMNDTFILTNGLDQPQKITESAGVLTVTSLATTLATGTITTSELVMSFKDHLLLMSNTENAADTPQRVTWGNIGALEDFVTGTAGYQDLVDDESFIIAAERLGENAVAIYKERSIVMMEWVGGHTPYRFTTMVYGTGCVSKEGVTDIGGEHIILGPDAVISYRGGTNIDVMDDSIRDTMYSNINKTQIGRSFVLYIEEDNEVQVWVPTLNDDPDEVWCYNTIRKSWYIKDRRMLGFGYYQRASSLTIGDLIGTIGEQDWRFGDALTKADAPITLIGDNGGKVYSLDKNTLDNGATAIVNEFQTPDFVLPDTPEYMNRFMRVPQLIFEAKGSSVTTTYSIDGGLTWSPTSTIGNNTTTLDSVYDIYQQDFDVVCRRIRFKFYNNAAASKYVIRYYGFDWKLRSGRR